MKVKIINYEKETLQIPKRAHHNDAGADVFIYEDIELNPHETKVVGLKFGLELPDGVSAYIFPRSSLAKNGLVCQLPPIDSGYRGEIHAIISNLTSSNQQMNAGDRVGQVVLFPTVICDFYEDDVVVKRESGNFGSTGK